MVEITMELPGQDYPLYHGGEEAGEDDGVGAVCYPQRPGELECQYYMKTGTCKYATKCKFHHPPDVTPTWGTVAPATDVTIGLNKESYPRRPGEQQCTFFLKTGTCKYKMSCKFDHPPEAIQQTLQLQATPYPMRPGELQCSYYLKTGKCKFGATCRFDHPAMAPEHATALAAGQYAGAGGAGGMNGHVGGAAGMHAMLAMGRVGMGYYEGTAGGGMLDMMGLPGQQMLANFGAGAPLAQLPQRPGEKECTFFLRTGRCQYGPRCKFHHPLDKLQGALMGLNGVHGGPHLSHPHVTGLHAPGFGHPGLEGLYSPYALPASGPAGLSHAGHLAMRAGAGGLGSSGAGGGGEGSLPLRPGQEPCSFYLRTGKCSYGPTCRFDHPRVGGVARELSSGAGSREGGREGGKVEAGQGGQTGAERGGVGDGGGVGAQADGQYAGGYAEGAHLYGTQQQGYTGATSGTYEGGGAGSRGGGGGGGAANGGYHAAEVYQQAFVGYPAQHHQYGGPSAVYGHYRQAS